MTLHAAHSLRFSITLFSLLPLISTVPLSTTLRSSLPRTHSSFFAWIRVSNPFGRTKRTLAKTLSYIERTRYFVHFAKEEKNKYPPGSNSPDNSPLEWIFTLKHSRAIRKQKKKKGKRRKQREKKIRDNEGGNNRAPRGSHVTASLTGRSRVEDAFLMILESWRLAASLDSISRGRRF